MVTKAVIFLVRHLKNVNFMFDYFGFAFMVSPDLGFTMASSLLILPGTLEEKLKMVTGYPLVMGILISNTTSWALNSLT